MLRQTVTSIEESVRAHQDTADSVLEVVTQANDISQLIDDIADYAERGGCKCGKNRRRD